MKVIHNLRMDLCRCGTTPQISAVQGEGNTRVVAAALYDKGVAWEIPEGTTAALAFNKPDGTRGLYDTLPNGDPALVINYNTVSVTLAPQVLTAAGKVSASVVLYDPDLDTLATFPFWIQVAANPAAGEIISNDYYKYSTLGALNEAIEELQAAIGIRVDEPAEDDIPKVFINGTIPATKDDVLAEMQYISKTESFHAYLKIKCQGTSSMAYPKKNFTIKLYSDEERETKLKKVFKDWGHESHKYVLKANWVDHSHARNIVCANLWDEVVSSRADYDTLPVEMRNSPRNGAVDGFPIKVYTNGTYQGLYTWNIGKDDWTFGMDEDNVNHVALCAETNTNDTFAETPCNFRALWDGVHENYWSVEVGTNSDAVKNSLNALITCVKDTDDETFKATLGNYLDVQSAMDYYIHQYVICGLDGLAKNMLLLTYDGTKWYCGAYDMDLTFGSTMGDDYFRPYNAQIPEDCNEKYSLLWSRLEEVFAEELVARYFELRKTVYSATNIINRVERFTDIISRDIYAEDGEVYPDIISLDTNNPKQIRNFIAPRLEYCDGEFEGMLPQEYTPITYLESDGNQYIDTGISGGVNASYEIKAQHTSDEYEVSSYGCLLGGATSGTIPYIIYFTWDGFHALADSASVFDAPLYWMKGTYNEATSVKCNSDGTVFSKTFGDWEEQTYLAGSPETVAGRGWGSSNWYAFSSSGRNVSLSMRIYYLKMYTDGVLVRDFVPVQRNYDGVYGLFDNVSKTFFGNEGTGAFTGA